MNCHEAQRLLPGYLDGAIHAQQHVRLRGHLESCERCRQELERYRLLATQLASVEPIAAPADLALRIRVQASQGPTPWAGIARLWSRAVLISQNILEPLAVPATGGILTALVVFVLVVQSTLVGVPLRGSVPNDLPLNLVEPARLETLAPFPLPGIVDAAGQPTSGGLLLEATLNAQGEVLFYKILSGPDDATVQRQIDQLLLFSRFRPQLSFGRPMDGGHVLLSFSEVRVRG
ncbi:MAG TPA: anti-sigma factor [Candidatus Polarisedimenticolia bacterium]|nr:anti-sigma factor [Candidatus Polarisedimenticolia bacterium]